MKYQLSFLVLSFVLLACGSNSGHAPSAAPTPGNIEVTASTGAPSSATASANQFIPLKPALSPDMNNNLQMLTDVVRSGSQDFATLFNLPALTAVTSEFGLTVIKTHNFPFTSSLAIANVVPWSSWWYPKKENFLYHDANGDFSSPLTKYDELRRERSQSSDSDDDSAEPHSAAEFEAKNANPNDLSWEGLCDAWALASIASPESKHPVVMNENGVRIRFEISDLKALLLKTYEAVDDSQLKYYGQKFTGDANGWIFPDIFPDQFHRFLEIQLFQNKQAFVMDHDPGVEVWNVPVYKANYTMSSIPNQPDSVFVRAWLFSAESVHPNEKEFVGTKLAIREYDYVLTGSRSDNGDLTITSGYWVVGPTGVDSRADHPDYFTRIPNLKKLVRKSWNPEIDVQLIDEILAKSY